MFGAHPLLILLSGVAWLVMMVASVVMLPVILVRMPADYFVRDEPAPSSWRHRHPIVRWSVRVLKNLCGVLLVLAGVMMLVGPGQGVLTMLTGVLMMDFPGKRKFELWLVRQPRVLASINWMRQRLNQPPLQLPVTEQH